LITFTLSGLWHGANWTYIAWGFLNGLYYLPHIYLNLSLNNISFRHPFIIKAVHVLQILITFFLIQISWIFFRSVSIYDAFLYINRLFSFSLFSYPTHLIDGKYNLLLIILFIIVEWIQREKEHGLDIVNRPIVLR
ncbi:MAG TPA: membrane-bound O-acyltransferase family protein, partial [Candidatus Latescibacteria bacterium]|nr:membrane-bound O-acyltransferase family protein [Candidatus Latescibacterota bacterium]